MRTLLPVLGALLLAGLLRAAPGNAMDLTIASVDPVSSIGVGIGKRIQRTLESGGRPSVWGLLAEIKSRPLAVQGRIGRATLRHPINLNLSLNAKPRLSPGRLQFDRRLDLSASRRLAEGIPPVIEVTIQNSEEKSAVLLLCKFNF